jgi:hypothetical protein
MGSRLQVAVALGAITGLAVGRASADELIANDPGDRAASTGFFAEGGLTAVSFVGNVNHDAAIGPGLDLRIGHDLFSWLSIGGFVAASMHQATLLPPPEGQYFQL